MDVSDSSDLRRARRHTALACEQIGDTLVVTPLGDLPEFAPNVFRDEFERVKRLAGREVVKNIVCDLSSKNYFGNDLVVPLIGLRNQIRTSGRFVAAGMPEEMQRLFEHSDSGTHLLHYPDRRSAVGAVAKASLATKVRIWTRTNRSLFLIAAVALLGIAGYFGWQAGGRYLVQGSLARQLYRDVERCWADTRNVVESEPTKANWNGLRDRIRDRLFDRSMELRKHSDRTDADVTVLSLADTLTGSAANVRTLLERQQESFLAKAETARTAIEQQDQIQIAPLEPIMYPAEKPHHK